MHVGYTKQAHPHPLALARKRAGLSVRALGQRTGVSYVTVSHVENRRVRPTEQTLAKLATALNVTVEDLKEQPQFQPHPDTDPDVPNLREFGLAGSYVVLHLSDPVVEYRKDGRLLATEEPDAIVIRGGTVRIEIAPSGSAS